MSTQPYGQASAVEAGCLVDPATGTIPGGDVSVIYLSCGMLGWRTLAGSPATNMYATQAGDMAIHSNGDIDVAYADTSQNVASFRYSNGAWVMLASTPGTCTAAQGCAAIEVDRNGMPYLATVNALAHSVYALGGGHWNALPAPTNSTADAGAPGLAFRSSNLPTLTSMETASYLFGIQDYDGSAWNAIAPATMYQIVDGSHPVVDCGDHLWTAACTTGGLYVYRDAVPSPWLSACAIGHFDLTMGADGTAYLVYASGTTVYLYKSTDNVSWTQVQTFTGAGPTRSFVNVDSSGHINVGYLDGSTFYLRASRGSSWVLSTMSLAYTPLRMRLKPDGLPCVFRPGAASSPPSVDCYGP